MINYRKFHKNCPNFRTIYRNVFRNYEKSLWNLAKTWRKLEKKKCIKIIKLGKKHC